MNIIDIKHITYKAEINPPVKTSRQLINYKEGIILLMKNDKGLIGLGEASPLPGFSNESIDNVKSILNELENSIGSGQNISSEGLLDYAIGSPALLFALEQALFIITLQVSDFIKIPTANISTNFLSGMSNIDYTIKQIEEALFHGYGTIKLKVGGKDFNSELKLIEIIRNYFPGLKIRLDVNSAWSMEDAAQRIKKLRIFNLELIEQPVEGLENLLTLSKFVDIPLAPDESIRSLDDAKSALDSDKVKFVVVKPMNIGFNNTINIIEHANKLCKNVIVSSLFESEVGKFGLLYLASLAIHNFAHGISTHISVTNLNIKTVFKEHNGIIEFDLPSYAQITELESLFK